LFRVFVPTRLAVRSARFRAREPVGEDPTH
jgi:hypothetical protein